jgi:hypothetical protein
MTLLAMIPSFVFAFLGSAIEHGVLHMSVRLLDEHEGSPRHGTLIWAIYPLFAA